MSRPYPTRPPMTPDGRYVPVRVRVRRVGRRAAEKATEAGGVLDGLSVPQALGAVLFLAWLALLWLAVEFGAGVLDAVISGPAGRDALTSVKDAGLFLVAGVMVLGGLNYAGVFAGAGWQQAARDEASDKTVETGEPHTADLSGIGRWRRVLLGMAWAAGWGWFWLVEFEALRSDSGVVIGLALALGLVLSAFAFMGLGMLAYGLFDRPPPPIRRMLIVAVRTVAFGMAGPALIWSSLNGWLEAWLATL